MPLQLVANLVPEDKSEGSSDWKFVEGNTLIKVSKDGSNAETSIDVGDSIAGKHLRVLQTFWNRVPQLGGESVDESIIRGLKLFTPTDEIAAVLNALNFASDMKTMFWRFCAWMYRQHGVLDDDVKSLMVEEDAWKVVKAFPCENVIEQAVRRVRNGVKLYDEIDKCGWDETDKDLWLMYARENFKEYTSDDELSDILLSVPYDLQQCDEMLKLMLQFQTLPLLKNLVRYAGETSDYVLDMCVDFLCSSSMQHEYINLFNLVSFYIHKSETWWRLMCEYTSYLVTEESLEKNVYAKYASVPDNICDKLCECPDWSSRTLRLALMVHTGTKFELSKSFELYSNELVLQQNIVVLIAKLCYSSQLRLVKMLMKERYFTLLQIPFKLMSGSFPFLQLAASKLEPQDMLLLHPLFKYDVDGSRNAKLDHLFYGDLCSHSKDSTCSQMYANLVMRVCFKNEIQIVQNDPFKLPYSSTLCAMCSNIYEAGINGDKVAIETFLQNPRWVAATSDTVQGLTWKCVFSNVAKRCKRKMSHVLMQYSKKRTETK